MRGSQGEHEAKYLLQVAYTHHSSIAPTTFPDGVTAFWVSAVVGCMRLAQRHIAHPERPTHSVRCSQTDLKSGEGLHEAFAKVGPIDAVINCAAMSSPAACEKDAATAR